MINASVFTFLIDQTISLYVGNPTTGDYVKSNKIVILADAYLGSNTATSATGEFSKPSVADATPDTLNFSYIKVGEFYWSPIAWSTMSAKTATYIGDTTGVLTIADSLLTATTTEKKLGSGSGTQSGAWLNAMSGNNTNISKGVGFTNYSSFISKNKDAMYINEGRGLDVLYKIKGIESIIGTNANDVWSYGTFYRVNNGPGYTWYNPYLGLTTTGSNYGEGTFNQFDPGDGIDTFLLNSLPDNFTETSLTGLGTHRNWFWGHSGSTTYKNYIYFLINSFSFVFQNTGFSQCTNKFQKSVPINRIDNLINFIIRIGLF
jgi:hypothetical protein